MAKKAGHFLDRLFARVGRELSRYRGAEGPLVLDAATGAGNSALAVARMLKRGRLVTVDNDREAWTDFARGKIAGAGLTGRVKFRRMDIARMEEFADASFDLIVCGATLSAMGAAAVDGIREFARVGKPGAFLGIYDLMPQGAPRTARQRNAVEAWRLSKAIEVLLGHRHYEEPPPEWVSRRFEEAGFAVEHFEVERAWADANEESVGEFLASRDYARIANAKMRAAMAQAVEKLKERIRGEGMSNFSRRYIVCGRRRAGE